MLYFTIENRKYSLPESLKDVSLAKFKEASKYYEEHRPTEGTSERDSLDYYMAFIRLFVQIDLNQLKKVKITDKEAFGIVELYTYLLKFLEVPNFEEFNPELEFNFKGINYVCIEKNLETLKHSQPLEEMTFEQYEDATTVLQNFEALKSEEEDAFSLLASILFRPKKKRFYMFNSVEQYNSANVKKRAVTFQELDMHKIYSAYFFLTEQINISLKGLKNYSEVLAEK